jgi:lauroyl/myristoyl acyltransferase
MIRATHELEAFVRRHPDQWLWMHRRWKSLATEQSLLADRQLGALG